MLQATELRIGNITLNPSNGRISVISVMDISDIENRYKQRDGLPLTPEILEKAGLYYERTKSKIDDETSVDVDAFSFDKSVITTGFLELHKLEAENKFFVTVINEYEIFVGSLKKCIEYVHQLQNLYFALNGEELEIKL